MAAPKGGNKGSFKKGNKMGQGRKKLPEDIRAARNLSYEQMCRTVIEVRSLTPGDAKKLDLEKEPLGKRAILNAYVKLDYRGIKNYEDRLWGKATETYKMKHGVDEESSGQIRGLLLTLSDDDIAHALNQAEIDDKQK